MTTTLYLIRHGATAMNLEHPPRLQGRRIDPPLAPLGVRQAELTRDALAAHSIDFIYSSPMQRAMETARILAADRQLPIRTVETITECDVGRWESQSWEAIRAAEPEAYARFMHDPGTFGYAGGETFAAVAERVIPALNALLDQHPGNSLLAVGHHVVNRVYLAHLLGLSPSAARRVKLDNCGISMVVRDERETCVRTLNATMHLGDAVESPG
jgi:broad specificity phosphatase PhoE